MPSTFLNLILLAGLVVQSSCVAPTLLGKFSYPHAAFSTLYQQGTSSRYDLLLSSFGIFSSNVAVVSDVGQYLQRVSSINTKTLTQNVKWPNEVTGVPPAVLKSSTRYMAIPDGFLVPGKTYGSVSLINVDGSQSSPKTITGGGNWFYHRVRWVDMDKDGRLDGLTARAHKPFIGSAQGQLLWLSNPAGHSIDSPWTENVIASGPDTFFEFSTLTAGGKSYEVILTSEFFDQKLRIFWTEDPQQNWKNTQYG
ncbi:uncharacterized protein LOC101858175 [Aplysia californica]|uniref:Uncharacterized protein LOC101858175 n=1 Tax=Aplysia californica TaxID=6500 RepID=A0ABM0ZXI6_APLCA|nr:uncharacterized protein LOC101858175 [Aplysia californica]